MEESKLSKVNQYKYHAFISYRHADNKEQGRQWATWLHQAIETYEVPKDLVGKKNGRGDVIPSRIYPIFRDEEELPAHADLGTSIVGALEQTNLLVVLCSPRAVASTYVADEIDYFKKLGGSDRIIAAMIDGEPNTSWDNSKLKLGFTKEDECFPLPLQFEYDQDGNPTDKHAEPIAADFRINNDGKPEESWTTPAAYREHLKATGQLDNKAIDKKVDNYQQQLHLMLLKIIAGILGVPLGELTQRDKEYQLEQERLKAKKLRQWLGAVIMLAIVAVGVSVFAYFQSEEAQRQEAIATNASEKAVAERDKSLLNQSSYILNLASKEIKKGNHDVGLLLALNAVPGKLGGERPEPKNKAPLNDAINNNRILFSTESERIKEHFISGNGEVLVLFTTNKKVEVWDIKSRKLIIEEVFKFNVTLINISDDGTTMAFKKEENGPIVLMSLQTGEYLKFINDDVIAKNLFLSKDGSRLAYFDGLFDPKLVVWSQLDSTDRGRWEKKESKRLSGLVKIKDVIDDNLHKKIARGRKLIENGITWSNTSDYILINSLGFILQVNTLENVLSLGNEQSLSDPISFNINDSKIAFVTKSSINDTYSVKLISVKSGKELLSFETNERVTSLEVLNEGVLYATSQGVSLKHLNGSSEIKKILKNQGVVKTVLTNNKNSVGVLVEGGRFLYSSTEPFDEFDVSWSVNNGVDEVFTLDNGFFEVLKNEGKFRIRRIESNLKSSWFGFNERIKSLVKGENSEIKWLAPKVEVVELYNSKLFLVIQEVERLTFVVLDLEKSEVLKLSEINKLLSCEKSTLYSKSGDVLYPEHSRLFKALQKKSYFECDIKIQDKHSEVYRKSLSKPIKSHLDFSNKIIVTEDKRKVVNIWDLNNLEIVYTSNGKVVDDTFTKSEGNEEVIIFEKVSEQKQLLKVIEFPSSNVIFEYDFGAMPLLGVKYSKLSNDKKILFILFSSNNGSFLSAISLNDSSVIWKKPYYLEHGVKPSFSQHGNYLFLKQSIYKSDSLISIHSIIDGKDVAFFGSELKPYRYELKRPSDLFLINMEGNLEVLNLNLLSTVTTFYSVAPLLDFYLGRNGEVVTVSGDHINYMHDDYRFSNFEAEKYVSPAFKCLSHAFRESSSLNKLTYRELVSRECEMKGEIADKLHNTMKYSKKMVSISFLFRQLYNRNPENIELANYYANYLYENGDFKKSSLIYKRLYDQNLLSEIGLVNYANSLYELKKFSDASLVYSKVGSYQDSINVMTSLAYSLYMSGDYLEAARQYRKLTEKKIRSGFAVKNWTKSLTSFGYSTLASGELSEFDNVINILQSYCDVLDYERHEESYSSLVTLMAAMHFESERYLMASRVIEGYFDKLSISVLNNNENELNRKLLTRRLNHYSDWSWIQLHAKNFNLITKYLPQLIEMTSDSEYTLKLYANLAHAHLYLGNYSEARKIYIKFKGVEFENGDTWNDFINSEFEKLFLKGIEHPDMARIYSSVFNAELKFTK